MEALELFERIGTGRGNALRRPTDKRTDRKLRRLINAANRSGKDCIINSGKGYYRPDFNSEEEAHEAKAYLNKELHRCREVAYKYKQMRMFVEDGIRRAEFDRWYLEKKNESEARRNE